MAKSKDTVDIENYLINFTKEKRIYGCPEVTIGFPHQHKANEIVDFMTIDSKDIIRCYEIKVSLADLKSNSKKSFYGHYNYLFITSELWEKIKRLDLTVYNIPNHVGIYISDKIYGKVSVRNATKQDISKEQIEMLKSSLIRSLYYKYDKYKTKYEEFDNKDIIEDLEKKLRNSKNRSNKFEKSFINCQMALYKLLWELDHHLHIKLDITETSSYNEIHNEIKKYLETVEL